MNWNTVRVLADPGTALRVTRSGRGELEIAVRAPGGQWPKAAVERAGENTIAPGHSAYVVKAADAPRVRRPYNPDGDALFELSRWCRKHYTFEVRGGPFCQPGDECYVRLSAGGRTVEVDEWELSVLDKDGAVETAPSLAEMIHAALRRWHEDAKPKRFRVLGEGRPMLSVTARNEAEAVTAVEAELAPCEFRLVELWEVAVPSAPPPGGENV